MKIINICICLKSKKVYTNDYLFIYVTGLEKLYQYNLVYF